MKSSNFRIIFRNFIIGISNLFQYSKIIWNDRDWDHAYIYYILIFKLKRQQKYLSKNQRYVGWERDVEIINTVIRLLERDIDSFYELEYQEYYQEKMVNKSSENYQNCGEIDFELISDNSTEYFLKHVSAWKRVIKNPKADSNLRKCLYLSKDRQQKCHDLAFELIKRNINKWWD